MLPRVYEKHVFLAPSAATHTKIRQFAAEAARLQLSDLRDLSQPGKRHTQILCLLFQVQATTRDELTEMFLRRMRKTEFAAKEQLRLLQEQHQEMEKILICLLGEVVQQAKGEFSDDELGCQVLRILEFQGGTDTVGAHEEGWPLTKELLGRLSPYRREHSSR